MRDRRSGGGRPEHPDPRRDLRGAECNCFRARDRKGLLLLQ